MIFFDKSRPLSWSAISSFEYDKEQWYRKYVLKQPDAPTSEMLFGGQVGKMIERGENKFPMVRHSKMEFPFKVYFGSIQLVGFADSFCDQTFKKLEEYKTGVKPWDQKRADNHGQIDMYLLMNYITHKIRPEEVECAITWLPTKKNGDFSVSLVEPVVPQRFVTKRSMQDILTFGERINRVFKEMEEYANKHK